MIFPEKIIRVPVKEKEVVKVKIQEGVILTGIIERIEKDYFYLKLENNKEYKLDFSIDQIIKLN